VRTVSPRPLAFLAEGDYDSAANASPLTPEASRVPVWANIRAKYRKTPSKVLRKTPSKDTFAILVENALSGRSTENILCGKHCQSVLDKLVYGTIIAVDDHAEPGMTWCCVDKEGYNTRHYKGRDTITLGWYPLSALELSGTEKEYTFTKKPLGIGVHKIGDKLIITPPKKGHLRPGIVTGSQLLSANKLRWDSSHDFVGFMDEITAMPLPITMSFKCLGHGEVWLRRRLPEVRGLSAPAKPSGF